MLLLQVKHSLALFVKMGAFLSGSGHLAHYDKVLLKAAETLTNEQINTQTNTQTNKPVVTAYISKLPIRPFLIYSA